MKHTLLSIYLLLSTLTLSAQNQFGNEWIQAGQKYLKFSTSQKGIYRVDFQDVQAADASFLQTNPVNWRLFFRGQEIAIRIVGEQDGRFETQDYIEFYGEGNDGSQDSLLYRPKKRLHPYQTLYSDTTAYFLTYSPTIAGKRIPELNLSSQGLTPEKFHLEQTVQAFTSDYSFNNLVGIEPSLQHSYFEPNEGWTGPIVKVDSVGRVAFNLTGRVTTDWPITLEGLLNGRDNYYHQVELFLNDATSALSTFYFSAFNTQSFQNTINPSSLQNEQLNLRFKSIKSSSVNNFSITYVKLTYPQAFDMANQTSKVFNLVSTSTPNALLSIANVPTGSLIYDITDTGDCRILSSQTVNGQTQVIAGETSRTNRTLLITNQFSKPKRIKSVQFSSTFPTSADYLIITHATLRPSVNVYAAYRASDQGGRHTPFIIDADSLYDQFNYGERSPLALRRFIDYMRVNSSIKNLLLVGRANSYPYTVKTTNNDWVPTIGYPGSDILLTAGLGNYSINTPAIPTGRLNVITNDQVLAYLEKIKQFELSSSNGIWRKNIIHISGGKTTSEAQTLRVALENIGTIFSNGLLGGKINTFSKTDFSQEVQKINIAPLVNDGVSMITFLGHAGPSVTDMNFGFATPVENGYQNTNYPMMIFNGCGVGEIFSKFNTLATDWLLAPQKGASIVLADSYFSYEQSTTWYLSKLYSSLYTNPATLGMPFGLVQQQLNQALDQEKIDSYQESVMLEMILQGDPAVSIYPLPNPDFAIDKSLYIQSSIAGSLIKSSDSIRVTVPLANIGKFVTGQSVDVLLKTTTSTGTTSKTFHFTSFRYRDTLVYTIPRDQNLQEIEVVIDPTNQITELDKTNNTATLTIDWSQIQGSSYPINAFPDVVPPAINVLIDGIMRENKATVNTNPKVDIYLVDQNPLSINDSTSVDVYLKSCESCTSEKISSSALSLSAISDNLLLVTTNLSLQAGNTYQLIIFGKDAAGNQTQPPYILDLQVVDNEESITLQVNPNPAISYANFELTLNTQELPEKSLLTIYSLSGTEVYKGSMPINTGKNSFLWQGGASGVYIYALSLNWSSGRQETHKGKLIWQK